MLFHLRPAFFDGVEVRRIGRKVKQFRSGGCDSIPDPVNFVSGKVVHYDNITRLELGTQGVVEEREKYVGVGCRFDCHRRNPAFDTNCAEHRHRSPSSRRGIVQPLTALRSSIASRRLRRNPAFVDKDQILRLNVLDR